jgi:hypothetical protein
MIDCHSMYGLMNYFSFLCLIILLPGDCVQSSQVGFVAGVYDVRPNIDRRYTSYTHTCHVMHVSTYMYA